jgi:hypothetical protein
MVAAKKSAPQNKAGAIARSSTPAAKKSLRSVTKSNATTEQPTDTCFTIMPFGGWFDDYYDSIYQPAITAAGLKPRRADDLYRPSTIVNDIWSYTKAAKIVLADLTGKNANVFYELGLAHALAKPVVLVAESMNDVPFDLRALRIIEYDKNEPRWGDSLRDKVTQSITEILASPLASVLPAFLETKHQPETKVLSEHERNMLELRHEIDLLRRELRLRDSVSTVETIRRREHIGPDEAISLIERYKKMGMPPDQILGRLRDRGVPLQWAEEQIKQMPTGTRVVRKPK